MTVRTLVPTLDRVLTLNRELDRVLSRNLGNATAWLPAMDVAERTDSFVVTLDVPGVSHESIDITFDRGALTIRGARTAPEYREEDKIYVSERTLGEFERVVRLPETIDADRIRASFDNGVVTIDVPKAEAARARKIAVSVSNGRHG
ncbi:MAG: Hsp20/alpha crystallin family protein [Gemmatimonadota bacterium]|nr:Hsp20/alpha crystallin family protein [Gemmatimonadota bacterium]